MLYKIENNVAVEWKGDPIDGIRHPPTIGNVWSDVELEAVGLYKLQNGDETVPDGMEYDSETIEVINGKPTVSRVFRPIDMQKMRSNTKCSRLQLKAMLLQYGLLEQVEALVLAGNDPVTMLAWAEASEFNRGSPLLNALIPYLTWNDVDNTPVLDTEIDDMFVAAANLEF